MSGAFPGAAPICSGGASRAEGRTGLAHLATDDSERFRSSSSWPIFPLARTALGDSHIFSSLGFCSEMPSKIDCIELLEAMADGDRSWRLAVAVPAAEAGDDPGSPGEAVERMGVLLTLGFAFEGGAKCGERFDLRLGESGGGGQTIAAVALLDELDGDGRGFDCGGGELDQALGAGELAFLQVEALGFHDAVHLLDRPTRFIPGDQTQRIGGAGDLMGSQETPVDPL